MLRRKKSLRRQSVPAPKFVARFHCRLVKSVLQFWFLLTSIKMREISTKSAPISGCWIL
ncbi:UNVERIFIED_CONTAM: hypothetical protein GTU68_000544 [Idotea baltica]|nr:hypothetical protein [Idotea baltica]